MALQCKCGTVTQHYFYCDVDPTGPWCEKCFSEHPCGKGEHEEGCLTDVVDTIKQIDTWPEGKKQSDA